MPEISALMSVYNGERYLRDAIDSILNQTYQDFEFIIVDDGSTDATVDIINSYNDKRIKLYRLPFNNGVGAALDFGLKQCSGKYIAKVDADDISHSKRFQIQKEYLDRNPDLTVVGSLINCFSTDEEVLKSERYRNLKNSYEKQVNSIISKEDIKQKLYWFCCINHPTVMIRSEIYKKMGYDHNLRIGEDYKLFYSLNKMGYLMEKIPEVLLNYRVSSTSITALYLEEMFRSTYELKQDLVKKIFQYQEVLIWGAGGFGKTLLKILRKEQLNPAGFIDSNENLWGTKIEGMNVYPPSYLRENKQKKGVIIASDPGKFAIANALERMEYRHLVNYIVF